MAENSVMAAIMFLQTSSFVTFDPTKFSFVGSIPEAMLLNDPTDNVIVNEYRKLRVFGVRPMPEDLKKAIEEGAKAKMGGKRKPKVVLSEVVPKTKKVKKQARKPRSPSLIA